MSQLRFSLWLVQMASQADSEINYTLPRNSDIDRLVSVRRYTKQHNQPCAASHKMPQVALMHQQKEEAQRRRRTKRTKSFNGMRKMSHPSYHLRRRIHQSLHHRLQLVRGSLCTSSILYMVTCNHNHSHVQKISRSYWITTIAVARRLR